MKISKKVMGIVVDSVGIVLLILGTLNLVGLLSFSLGASGAPSLLYSYPGNAGFCLTGDQFCFYARAFNISVPIASVYYQDNKYVTSMVMLNPSSTDSVPNGLPTFGSTSGKVFPDMNHDGKIDLADLALWNVAFSKAYVTGAPYNASIDLNHDDKVDMKDSGIFNQMLGTSIYLYTESQLKAGDKIIATLKVIDNNGNVDTELISFTVGNFNTLSGYWCVDGVKYTFVATTVWNESQFTIGFNSTDSLSDTDIAVTIDAALANKTYIVPKVATNCWSLTVNVGSQCLEKDSIICQALSSSTGKINRFNLQVRDYLTAPDNTLGIIFSVVGGVILIPGSFLIITNISSKEKVKSKKAW